MSRLLFGDGIMTNQFDLIVIGSGAAAQTVIYPCAEAGWKVAVVEERLLGGTCALRGCIPKKVLVGATEIIDQVNNMTGKGVSAENIEINWSELIKFKKTFTDDKPDQLKQSLNDAGIAIYQGHASFLDQHTIEVDGKKLTSTYFFIATGARPRPLDIPGSEHVITSDEFFNLMKLPSSIVFIGGGYISFELAHIASRAGAMVTILHRSSHPLRQFEPDLVDSLLKATQDYRIDVETNMPVNKVEKQGNSYVVIAGESNKEFSADLVIHGAGRIPNITDLGLDKAQVSTSKKGIEVNKHMQSPSNPSVFAAGDVSASGLPLTPVAGAEGKVVVRNLLKKGKHPSTISVIPSTLFTIPPLSSVGLTEHQAEEKDLSFRVNSQDTSSWYSAKRIGLKYARFKVIIDEDTDEILGAHLLGNHAEEVINIFALAMKEHITVTQLKDMIWSYPTSTYDLNYML